MLCKEIMNTELAYVTPRDTVQTAARRMRDARVGFLTVCDSQKRVLGAITDRDLALRVIAADRPPETAIELVMTHEVVACQPDDDVRRAEKLMGENRKSRIVCTDTDGRLLGVISLSDIAQHEAEQQRVAETMRRVTIREVRV